MKHFHVKNCSRALMLCLALPLTLLLTSCATVTGRDYAMTFDCPHLSEAMESYDEQLPQHSAIQAAAIDAETLGSGGGRALSSSMILKALVPHSGAVVEGGPQPRAIPIDLPHRSRILLLSGGGQWGAFGAGFLDELRRENKLGQVDIVTGISTGALQAIVLAGSVAPHAGERGAIERAYDIVREDELVRDGGLWSALNKGSLATQEPLRSRIESALCPDQPEHGCPMLYKIAGYCPDGLRINCPGRPDMSQLAPTPYVFIGAVNARTGQFVIVDIVALLRKIMRPDEKNGAVLATQRAQAQQCLTGLMLSSSSMPLFLQRVKIHYVEQAASADAIAPAATVERNDIFYDGGVRHSVFESAIVATARQADDEITTMQKDAHDTQDRSPRVDVVRNGPTTVTVDDNINNQGDAYHAAMRGYKLIVNETEVTSIRALRLTHPTGCIRYVTADSFELASSEPKCAGRPDSGEIFNPQKMCQLEIYGAAKASTGRWTELPPLNQTIDHKCAAAF